MPAPAFDQIELLVAKALGAPARILGAEHLAPWSVMRCTLHTNVVGGPASLIVKWLRDDPNGWRVDLRRVATERAALEFLAKIDFPSAPRLIGADLEGGVLILEDISPSTPLADLLRRQGVAASLAHLHEFARASGALSAATAGRSEAYRAIRALYGPVDPTNGRLLGLGEGWADTRHIMEAFGLSMTTTAEGELAEAVERLLHPGAFLAFSNGDPEANNFLVSERGGWLIDFETSDFRHALTSATWIHVPGPAWITVAPEAVQADLEQTYRSALSQGVPEAEDDRLFGEGMAAACATMAYERLNRVSILDKRPVGDPSRVQMVATLEAAARVAQRHRALLHLAGWLERAADGLRARWPDADVDFATYPPYTPRS